MFVVEVKVTDGDKPTMITEVRIPRDVIDDPNDDFMEFVSGRVELDWDEWVSNGYMWKV
jgi:hypothetical protein